MKKSISLLTVTPTTLKLAKHSLGSSTLAPTVYKKHHLTLPSTAYIKSSMLTHLVRTTPVASSSGLYPHLIGRTLVGGYTPIGVGKILHKYTFPVGLTAYVPIACYIGTIYSISSTGIVTTLCTLSSGATCYATIPYSVLRGRIRAKHIRIV